MIDSDGLWFDSEIEELVGPLGTFFYERLWSIAEDSGVYSPRFKDLHYQTGAFGRHYPIEHIKHYISKLIAGRKIIPFKDEDGAEFHWIRNFHKHQKLDNSPLPTYPLPPWITMKIVQRGNRKIAKYSTNDQALKKFLKDFSPKNRETSEKSTRTQTNGETSTTSTTSPLVDDESTTGRRRVVRNRKERKGIKESPDRGLTLKNEPFSSRILLGEKRLRRIFTFKSRKFPHQWLQMKENAGWDPKLITEVFEMAVSRSIAQHKRKPIKSLWPYFEEIWKIEAPNIREASFREEHEKLKKEEGDFASRLEGLAGRVGKKL